MCMDASIRSGNSPAMNYSFDSGLYTTTKKKVFWWGKYYDSNVVNGDCYTLLGFKLLDLDHIQY